MTSAPATVSSPMLDPLATTHQRNPKLGEPTTVRGAFFEVARRLGLTTIFGNPGSTEETLLEDFPDDFRYVLALQEASAIGMADGYAQATGKAALVSLHTAAGLDEEGRPGCPRPTRCTAAFSLRPFGRCARSSKATTWSSSSGPGVPLLHVRPGRLLASRHAPGAHHRQPLGGRTRHGRRQHPGRPGDGLRCAGRARVQSEATGPVRECDSRLFSGRRGACGRLMGST